MWRKFATCAVGYGRGGARYKDIFSSKICVAKPTLRVVLFEDVIGTRCAEWAVNLECCGLRAIGAAYSSHDTECVTFSHLVLPICSYCYTLPRSRPKLGEGHGASSH